MREIKMIDGHVDAITRAIWDSDNTIPFSAVRKCPVCGSTVFPESTNSFEVCPTCGWIDDEYQEENPDEDRCGNKRSLNQAIEMYKNTGYTR